MYIFICNVSTIYTNHAYFYDLYLFMYIQFIVIFNTINSIVFIYFHKLDILKYVFVMMKRNTENNALVSMKTKITGEYVMLIHAREEAALGGTCPLTKSQHLLRQACIIYRKILKSILSLIMDKFFNNNHSL